MYLDPIFAIWKMCHVRKFTFSPMYSIEMASTCICYFEEKIIWKEQLEQNRRNSVVMAACAPGPCCIMTCSQMLLVLILIRDHVSFTWPPPEGECSFFFSLSLGVSTKACKIGLMSLQWISQLMNQISITRSKQTFSTDALAPEFPWLLQREA